MQILNPVILKVPPDFQALEVPRRVRALSELARRAVRLSAAKSKVSVDELVKNEDGVPQPCRKVHWSLSHKNRYVGGVVAPAPVGIDVERIKSVRAGLYAKVASENEWVLGGGKTELLFFRYWTAKEAVLKVAGIGIRGLRRCRVEKIVDCRSMTLSLSSRHFLIEHILFDHHITAVTRLKGLNLAWSMPHDLPF